MSWPRLTWHGERRVRDRVGARDALSVAAEAYANGFRPQDVPRGLANFLVKCNGGRHRDVCAWKGKAWVFGDSGALVTVLNLPHNLARLETKLRRKSTDADKAGEEEGS